MEQNLLGRAAEFILKQRRHKRWQKAVSGMAAVVVFCTTYALILPAITLSNDTLCGLEEHAHTETCWTAETHYPQSEMACTLETEALVVHSHDDLCYSEDGTRICQLEELETHSHGSACYWSSQELTCSENEDRGHSHGAQCYASHRGEMTCTQAEDPGHSHGDGCYSTSSELSCSDESEEHSHDAGCYTETSTLTCSEEARPGHSHDDGCYAWTEELTCTVEERPAGHIHGDDCYITVTELDCDREEIRLHSHSDSCCDETGALTCEKDEVVRHQHTADCIIPPEGDPWEEQVLTCGQEAHSHGESCYPAEELTPEDMAGMEEDLTAENTICGQEAHTHDETCPEDCVVPEHVHDETCLAEEPATEEELANAQRVIEMIDAMPSADEIDAALLEYEAVEDWEGYEAYYADVVARVQETYSAYYYLTDREKALVTNAEKLLELEYIWSAVPLIEEITSATPTVVTKTESENPVVSTSDFVTLNIYDYYGAKSAAAAGKTNINSLWTNNKKYPGFQWNGGAYMTSSSFSRSRVDNIDFGNSMITDFTYDGTTSGIEDGVSQNYQKVGNQGGTINQVIGYTVQPIGYSSGSAYDALQHTLKNGYPALSDGTSLSYLFSESSYAGKKNTVSIDGLFRQNQITGEYWFDSRVNHAQYDDENNNFTLYHQIITPNFILYPFGNFLPFNDITNGDKATQVSAIDYVVQGSNGKSGYMQTIINRLLEDSEDATEQQLVDMLARYRNSLPDDRSNASGRYDWSVEEALVDYFEGSSEFKDDYDYATLFNSAYGQDLLSRLYNIDFDVEKNFLFGMDMEMNFLQPKDGMTGNDTNKDGAPDYPMKFEFAGDDDVWVFIDDVLFLDLTGIHRHVGGDIDFVNGVVNYYMMESYIDGAVSETPYKTMTFADILTDIGNIAEADLGNYLKQDANGNYTTFKDYTTHNFKFYYMERGTGSSVCRINFNFPLIKKNSITVSKQNVPDNADVELLGSPDYYFNIIANTSPEQLFVGPSSKTGINTYKVMDSAGNYILGEDGQPKLYSTDEYGIFTLKAGQTAIFEDIPENSGTYYVQELIKEKDHQQYDGTVTINGVDSRYNSMITWSSRSWASGFDPNDGTIGPYNSRWYGYSSQDTNADADRTFHFDAQNDVVTQRLGKLAIEKKIEDYVVPMALTDPPAFAMYVTLNSVPLPSGTAYDVYDVETGTKLRTDTVETAGQVIIAHGERAVISNILAGTEFRVTETAASAAGYTVGYQVSGGTVSGSAAEGVIQTYESDADIVQVLVTNSEQGGYVEIPIHKTLLNPDSAQRTFTFRVEQVNADGSYTVIDPEFEITLEPGEEQNSDSFVLTYIDPEIGTLPATYTYRITENTGEPGVVYDTAVYLVTVTVSQGTGGLTAEITGITKDGVAASAVTFRNEVVRYTLPETGGGGTGPYATAGLLTMLGAAYLLYKEYVRRKEGAASTS